MIKNFIKEPLSLLMEMYEQEEDECRKQKLTALILFKQSRVDTYQNLIEITGNSHNQLSSWFSTYRKHGLEIFLGLKKCSKNSERKRQKRIKSETILTVDGQVFLYKTFFTSKESERFFQDLLQEVKWRHDTIKHFGKELPLPRLTAWYGDAGKVYTYSKIRMEPLVWIPQLLKIKKRIEKVSNCRFNSVLLNQYRDGRDSVAWHSDDEKELGENPIIASVSFGGTRQFMLKHKTRKDIDPITIDLTSGSLLLMKDKTQECWLHQIPKTKKEVTPRINLTFRTIIN